MDRSTRLDKALLAFKVHFGLATSSDWLPD
jgi:hypothetical protein